MNTDAQQERARAVFIRAPRVMTEEQLRTALGSLADDDPRWLAVNQLVDRALASAVYDSSDSKLDPTKGTYPGGRIASLAELKQELADYRQAPVKTAAPMQAKGKVRR